MRLFFLVFSLAATVLSGVGITVVLAAGMPGWQPIVAAAAVGAVLALPATWAATRRISQL
ncbi:CTP synthetase [Roseibacterium sp. SDUM158016]|uniref:CTP synthetase n=1 Tax=Roseicyclus sediminis TaxID=2980997 RepID=UPI0021D246A5|nr:CTP synthetase [Roseibacterium sp. SDUM158016]MCU4653178.1 CTP synthetase [Roseibacterium sp. SDUM158016]